MAITNGYATLDEFQAWAQIAGTAKVAQMELAVESASRAVDEWCQRHFWRDGTSGTPKARTFETCDPCLVDFGPFNDLTVVVVPTVETDEAGDGTFETTWAATDYQLLPFSRPTGRPHRKIEAVAALRFPVRHAHDTGRRDRVRVTGVWGWDAVPVEVKQATLIKATRVLTRMQSPNGVAGVGDFGPIRISRFEDPDVTMLLEPYRHPAVVVLVA